MDYSIHADRYPEIQINRVPISRSCPSFTDGSQPLGRRRPPTNPPNSNGQISITPMGTPIKGFW